MRKVQEDIQIVDRRPVCRYIDRRNRRANIGDRGRYIHRIVCFACIHNEIGQWQIAAIEDSIAIQILEDKGVVSVVLGETKVVAKGEIVWICERYCVKVVGRCEHPAWKFDANAVGPIGQRRESIISRRIDGSLLLACIKETVGVCI